MPTIPAKKTATKPAAKAGPKPKAKASPKAGSDNARKVSVASDGKLNTDQVRVLRACQSGRPTTMRQIKSFLGMAPEEKYSGKFLTGIHELIRRKLLTCTKDEGNRAFEYTLTANGRKLLIESQKSAVAIEKASSK